MLCERCHSLFRGKLGLRASGSDSWSDTSSDNSSDSIEGRSTDRSSDPLKGLPTHPLSEPSTSAVGPKSEASSDQWEDASDDSSIYGIEDSDEESDSSIDIDSDSTSSQPRKKMSSKTREHHSSALTLQASMQQGCQICHSLWHKMTQEVEGADLLSFESPVLSTEVQFTRSKKQKKDLNVDFDANEYFRGDHFSDDASFSFKLRQVSMGSSLETNATESKSTGSESSWKIAQQWLNQCQRRHAKCRTLPHRSHFRPTRVLDVGAPGSTGIKLCLLEQQNETLEYITLSHCWGKKPIVRLLKANLLEMLADISMDRLPQTFRDAVQVSRRLGVQFLWIDSLCIIQDSIEDWQDESARMEEVYSNALCNLAATGSSDGNGGLFRTHDPTLGSAHNLMTEWEDFENHEYVLIDEDLWNRNVYRSPLCNRAWVLQELCLAPRVLHFGAEQLLWECQELQACEMFPDGIPEAVESRQLRFERTSGSDSETSDTSSDQASLELAFHESEWEYILETYTSCQLTKEKDKLVALSGLTNRLERLLNDKSVAGLWRKCLAGQLLWCVDRTASSKGPTTWRQKSYRAPSWSWAAIDGPVKSTWMFFDFDGRKPLIEILECNVAYVNGMDRTGQISDASIRLSGSLYPVTIHSKQHKDSGARDVDLKVGKHEIDCNVFLDVLPDYKKLPAFCLPIAQVSEGSPTCDALLLVPQSSGAQGSYLRVGMALLSLKRDGNLEEFMKWRFPRDSVEERKRRLLYGSAADQTLTLV